MTKKYSKILLIGFACLMAGNYIVSNYTVNILFPMFKALYLMASLFIIGYFFSNIKQPTTGNLLEYISKGMVFSCFYLFLVASIKQLNHISLGLYLIFPFILVSIIIRDKTNRANLLADLKNFFKRHPFEYLIFLFPLLYAALPSTFYDSLVYHLGLPNFYLQNGGFIEAPQFMYSNMFIYYEISLIPATFLGDFVPRLFHFLLGAVFILGVVDHSARVFKIKKRFILLITIVTLPLTMFLITAVKADLITALFIFMGIKHYYDGDYKWSAIFWGFAVGVKVSSGIALFIFFLLMILKNKKLTLKRHIPLGLIITLVLLPLVIKNFLITGNPFFPFFSQIFSSEFWDISRYSIVRAEVGTHYHTILDLIKAPYSFSFQLQGAGGMVGPLFLIFLPFLIFQKFKRKYILFFALVLLFIGPFFGEAFRYIYIVFILLSIFVSISYESLNLKPIKIIFIIVVFVNFIIAFSTVESIYKARLIYFNKTNIDEYKTHFFPTFHAISTINHITPREARILITGECRSFYLKRPYMIASALDYSIFKPYLNASTTPEEFLEKIKGDGYDYIIFNLSEFKRLQGYKRLTEAETQKLILFLNQIKPSHQEAPLYIYKL